MQMGISASYDSQIYHGESYDVSDDDMPVDEVDGASDDLNDDDDLDEMLNNIGQSKWGDNWQAGGEPSCTFDKDLETLQRLMDESHQELYDGSSNQWRKDKKNFDGMVDMQEPLTTMSGNEILDEVDVFFNSRECKSSEDKRGWRKKSVSTPRALYDVHVQMEEVHQEQEPHLNLTVDLNINQLSLTRGGVPLDMVDGITVALHDITQKACTNEYIKNKDPFVAEYGTRESKEVTLEGRVQFDLLEGLMGRGSSLNIGNLVTSTSGPLENESAVIKDYNRIEVSYSNLNEAEEEHEEDYEEGCEADYEEEEHEEGREGDYEEEEHEVDSVREENSGSTSHGVSVTRKESRALNEAKKRRSNKETLVFEVDECAGTLSFL
ncbi:hypothetical protein L1887_32140 [Cichorium endivia]|nr:hypothetical protein L1887_32140 [Cichorium endivia]